MTSLQELKAIGTELRKELVVKHSEAKMAHIGSDLSCLDIMITLYFRVLGKDDHFILSKGHAALALYAVLHKKGIITDQVYGTLGKNGSMLGEHPIYGIKGIEAATGSLGHGLSIGAGIALAKKLDGSKGTVYVLLSDGECQEGSTLEAMNFAGLHKLGNLVAIVDSNKFQAYDRTLIPDSQVQKEFDTAGWTTKRIPGHDFIELESNLRKTSAAPTLYIADTVLGKGVSDMEDKLEWHYKSPTKEQVDEFVKKIK
ncbi:MAG: transketolase [Candidatus Micrarchaeota archaeon]|nr:transketolase [Candidatus Micrarchaeota archaeon]